MLEKLIGRYLESSRATKNAIGSSLTWGGVAIGAGGYYFIPNRWVDAFLLCIGIWCMVIAGYLLYRWSKQLKEEGF